MSNFTLREGKRYRATLSLGLLQRFATNERLEVELKRLGFVEVVVTGHGSTRHAEGRWTGKVTAAPLSPIVVSIEELIEPLRSD